MSQNIWCFRVGNFIQDAKTGWGRSIRFNGFKDLIESLKKFNLQRQVGTLVIVAHGDAGGLVQLDRDLTSSNVASFKSELTELREFFEDSGGKLIFVSCVAAVGPDGDKLLTAISQIMTNTHVVGFTVNGVLPQEGLPSAPGVVLSGDGTISGGVTAEMMRKMEKLTEYSPFSKWARNGYITKIPYQEQVRNKGNRCAWSLCPGHSSSLHRCQPAIKGIVNPRPYPG